MTESILAWMQQHESRFSRTQPLLSDSLEDLQEVDQKGNEQRILKRSKPNPQKSLDAFLPKSPGETSELFDSEFTIDEFRKLTKKILSF